jgi:chromosome segregation ATPase
MTALFDAVDEIDKLKVENDRLRGALAELKGQWERMLENYASADAEAERAEAEIDRLREALTPSAETKAAYMSEFSVPFPDVDENGEEYIRRTNVPWVTIKEIMKAISARAALAGAGNDHMEEGALAKEAGQ